jgi:hypothetical protein
VDACGPGEGRGSERCGRPLSFFAAQVNDVFMLIFQLYSHGYIFELATLNKFCIFWLL